MKEENELIRLIYFFKKTEKLLIPILGGLLLTLKIKVLASTTKGRCSCSGGFYGTCMRSCFCLMCV